MKLSKLLPLCMSILVAVSLLSINNAAKATTIANFPAGFTFTKNLNYGMTDPDVMRLQQVLNTNAATRVAASGPGSSGNETDYFGSLTKAAVIDFQQLYSNNILAPLGLTSGTGYVGPSTRAVLNSIISGTATTECPTGYICTPNSTVNGTVSASCPTGYVCTPNSTNQTSTYQPYYSSNTSYSASPTTPLPTVTMFVNGQSNYVSVPTGSSISLSWTSTNATYCSPNSAGTSAEQPSGSTNFTITQSVTATMYCFGPGGQSSSVIEINAQQPAASASSQSTTDTTGTNLSYNYSANNAQSTTGTNSTSNTSFSSPNTGSALITSGTSLLATSATSTKKTATSTETLDYGTVNTVIPCTFDPGNFYVDFTTNSSLTIVPKTASSTNTSSTTATSTTINSTGDKSYVWVLGSSQLYYGGTFAPISAKASTTTMPTGGSEVDTGFVSALPPLGDTLDMVIQKTNQSCDPFGSGYLIEKAYMRPVGL